MCQDSPAAPDYSGAANATAAGDLAAARSATRANRVNTYNPYGSQTYQQDATNPDLWTSSINLSPTQQQIFDINQSGQVDLANLARQSTANAASTLGTPFSTAQFGQMDSGTENRQKVMDAMLSRVNSQNASDVDAKRSELIAAGIPMGSKAYQGQMSALDSKLTDARQQAEIAANSQAQQQQQMNLAARQQQISEALLGRQTGLNEMNALRSGSQVSLPQFSSAPGQTTTGGANALGAAQAQGAAAQNAYATNTAQQNAALSGLFQLGSAYLSS